MPSAYTSPPEAIHCYWGSMSTLKVKVDIMRWRILRWLISRFTPEQVVSQLWLSRASSKQATATEQKCFIADDVFAEEMKMLGEQDFILQDALTSIRDQALTTSHLSHLIPLQFWLFCNRLWNLKVSFCTYQMSIWKC